MISYIVEINFERTFFSNEELMKDFLAKRRAVPLRPIIAVYELSVETGLKNVSDKYLGFK